MASSSSSRNRSISVASSGGGVSGGTMKRNIYEQKLGRFVDGTNLSPSTYLLQQKKKRDGWIQSPMNNNNSIITAISSPRSVGESTATATTPSSMSKLIERDMMQSVTDGISKLHIQEIVVEGHEGAAQMDTRELLNLSLEGGNSLFIPTSDATVSNYNGESSLPNTLQSIREQPTASIVSQTSEYSTLILTDVIERDNRNNLDRSRLSLDRLIEKRLSISALDRNSSPLQKNKKMVARVSGSPSLQYLLNESLNAGSISTKTKEEEFNHENLENSSNNISASFSHSPKKRASRSVVIARSLLNVSFQSEQAPVPAELLDTIKNLEKEIEETETLIQQKRADLQQVSSQMAEELESLKHKCNEAEARNDDLRDALDAVLAEKQKLKKQNVRAAIDFYEKKKISEKIQSAVQQIAEQYEERKLYAESLTTDLDKHHEASKREREENEAAQKHHTNHLPSSAFLSLRTSRIQEQLKKELHEARIETEYLQRQLLEVHTMKLRETMETIEDMAMSARIHGNDALNETIHMKETCERAQKSNENTILVDESVILF
jgi:hypothetical protein